MKLEKLSGNSWVFEDSLPIDAHEACDNAIDLWHSGNFKVAEQSFLSLIHKYPTHIDAIHHYSLMLSMIDRDVEALLACRAAVSIGLETIPKEFSWETSTLDWGSIDNRPFMRAYKNLGLHQLKQKEVHEAEKIFTRLLSVNPNDNQGCRYILPKIWFEKSELCLIVEHCQKMDELAPEISYSLSLALILLDRQDEAKESLKVAVNGLPLVRKELLKKRHTRPKGMTKGSMTHGGQDQAYIYWEEYGKFWESSVKAMEILLATG